MDFWELIINHNESENSTITMPVRSEHVAKSEQKKSFL